MTARVLSQLYGALWWAAWALLTAAVVATPATSDWLSRAEGARWPVVAPAVLTGSTPAGDNYTRIWGQSRKLRACPFIAIEWELVTPAGQSVVSVEFEDRAVVRPVGDFSFGPWRIHIAPSDLAHSRAWAVHQCHPGWPTRTLFWAAP